MVRLKLTYHCIDFAGVDVETEVIVENDNLTLIVRGGYGPGSYPAGYGPLKTMREVNGDTMIITTHVMDKDIKSTRTFKRIK